MHSRARCRYEYTVGTSRAARLRDSEASAEFVSNIYPARRIILVCAMLDMLTLYL